MEYLWIEDIKEFQNISKKWDEVLLASGSDNPFLLSDFILTWWKYYYRENKLRIFVIFENNAIMGGIPLYLKQEGWRRGYLNSLYYIGGSAASYSEPLFQSSSGHSALLRSKFWPIFLRALEGRQDWDLIHLFNVRHNSVLIKQWDSHCLGSKMSVHFIQDHMNWAIDLSNGVENYLSQLSKKLKQDLKYRRRLAIRQYGELILKEMNTAEEVEQYFGLYVNFSRHSFKVRNGHSIFDDELYSLFVKDFLILMNQHGRLRTHVLFSGDKVIAISFGYRFGKGFDFVLTAFNYECRSIRPGYLLVEEMLKRVVSEGESFYNWYGHYKFYKSQMCNLVEPLYRIKVVKKNMYTHSLNWLEETVRSSPRLVKSLKLFESYVR